MKKNSICDNCAHYTYDEEAEEYFCMVNLDEDEMARFMSHFRFECPYFRLDDEYRLVRKQM
ncbi:MAG: hypothetical protein HFG49_10520 [Lachnospiraceae bacterium]|jgi:hypothetical protein|nr:hypothetical protein [Lachnospiraceae bacterium]